MLLNKPFTEEEIAKLNRIRLYFAEGEQLLRELCPEGTKQRIALEKNDEAASWAVEALLFDTTP